jgi:hypothetical protein
MVLLVLGLSGFIRQSSDLDLDTSFLDQLYFTLQLAALDYKGASAEINWQLQVVRFAAPLMAAGTLLQSASVVFRDQFARWRAGRATGHTIVCGLEPVGTRLLEALVADGRNVVAITPEPASAGAATAARLGVPLVVGDPTDTAVLRSARADRATRVVAATDSDAVNVAITARLRDIDRSPARPPLRCAVRLNDGELAHLLRTTELSGDGSLRLEFFNVQERSAHALMTAHPVVGNDATDGDVDGDVEPHLVVMGVGQFGGNVIVTAAQQWAERDRGPLPITLIDRRARGRLHALVMQHPALATAIDATCIDLDIGAPAEAAVAQFESTLAERPPTLVVVAFEDEALAWTSGLFVRRRLMHPVDIVVRTDADGGFGRHLQTAIGDASQRGRIVSFPFLERACSTELIEGGVREQLAESMHEDHVLRTGVRSDGLHRTWADLDDADRESSRAAADALVQRLADVGTHLVPLQRWDVGELPLSEDEIDRMAAAEHERWRQSRLASGWTWGPTRDDALRHNPLLVEWSELSPEARADNLAAVAALPKMLARAGFAIEHV